MSKETEVFGVNYERFSVGRKLDRLAQKYNLRTILEMPAHGAKAMPSIYSLGFANMYLNGRRYMQITKSNGLMKGICVIQGLQTIHLTLYGILHIYQFAKNQMILLRK